MNISLERVQAICVVLLVLCGCATHGGYRVKPTPILQAQEEIPEQELMDVGITVFDSAELDEKQAKKDGTHPDVRKAESHYIPYHLKNTLQRSSYWGAVRVMPTESDGADVLVKGEVIRSNGEQLILKVNVVDSAGNTWLSKQYKATATEFFYGGNTPGEKDAFQDLYNTVANDIAAYRNKLSSEEIRNIRTISKLKFAQDFAPDAYGDYLLTNKKGKTTINRLPAEDDPLMDRLLRIREREYMYVDTLNEYYDGYYNDMWPAYENWRMLNQTELSALREIRRSAFIKQATGVLMLVLAVGLDIGNVGGTGALQNIMIVGGGMVIVDGINVSKQADIHVGALQELSDSFGSDMQPVVMELEGNQYELTGSAEEQYDRWRELLRQIYFTETGFAETEEESSEQ